ncbi:MAG: hypothetical protein HGGPFJEG_01570 [Ignavibacteria bacterium]|nr:hypothetical protein [Ignavibacteria bacterium]
MKFSKGGLFHLYNKGNNRQNIFFNHENYLYFLRKIRKYIYPNCDLLSYCLLPSQFNLMIYANNQTVSLDKKGRNLLSEGVKLLLSSYAKAINVQEKRTGSLFTQNTHCKAINKSVNQAFICFKYIHQLPVILGLVDNIEDWNYSSFRDYYGIRKGTLCNKNFAVKIFNLTEDSFYLKSKEIMTKSEIKSIL